MKKAFIYSFSFIIYSIFLYYCLTMFLLSKYLERISGLLNCFCLLLISCFRFFFILFQILFSSFQCYLLHSLLRLIFMLRSSSIYLLSSCLLRHFIHIVFSFPFQFNFFSSSFYLSPLLLLSIYYIYSLVYYFLLNEKCSH